jgi:DNA polymerase III subunit epsilon
MSWRNWFGWRQKHTDVVQHQLTERWVVLDVETSGLDTKMAQLLAIACVAVNIDWKTRQITLIPGDSFEVNVQPTTWVTDKANILVHNIGQQSQAQGLPIAQALQIFMDFVGNAPLLAFHAGFDAQVLGRHMQETLQRRMSNDWLDIELLCKITHPKAHAHTLDEWLAHFGIVCANRHQAAADAWSEAEVLQRIWPQLARQCSSWRDLQRLTQQQRWMR